jgi:hypothetical protein
MKPNWQKTLLYITIIGMEGCWLYTLVALLNKQVAGGYLSVMGILLIYPLAFVFNFLLKRLRWPKVCFWSVSWLLWAMGMLVIVKIQLAGNLAWSDTAWLLSVPRSIAEVIYTFKPELLVFLITAVMWWLGRRLSRLNVTFGTLVSEFQFGLIMLVLIFFIASQLKTGMGNPVPVALTFFLFALIGISVAHALEGTSWLSGLYQGHWSGLLLASIGVILILGLLISLIVTPDFLHVVWDAIKWVWGLIWGLILKIMALLASLFPESEPAELPPMPDMPAAGSDEGFRLTMPEWLRSGLRFGWTVLMVGFVLFALWRISSDIFRWLRRKLAGMAGAEYEPLPGAFKADLLSLLKRIILKLLRLKLPFWLKKREGAFPPETTSVRQIYRQFLRWAASAGYPRYISQTPQEYCYTLVDLVPEAIEDIDMVTQQYVKARYGARLSTKNELNELSQAWRRVKQIRLKRATTERTHKKEVN